MPARIEFAVINAHIQHIGDPAVGCSNELVVDLAHLSADHRRELTKLLENGDGRLVLTIEREGG